MNRHDSQYHNIHCLSHPPTHQLYRTYLLPELGSLWMYMCVCMLLIKREFSNFRTHTPKIPEVGMRGSISNVPQYRSDVIRNGACTTGIVRIQHLSEQGSVSGVSCLNPQAKCKYYNYALEYACACKCLRGLTSQSHSRAGYDQGCAVLSLTFL